MEDYTSIISEEFTDEYGEEAAEDMEAFLSSSPFPIQAYTDERGCLVKW